MTIAQQRTSALPMAIMLVGLFAYQAQGQFTPWWFDGFDVSAGSSDINFEIATTRQGGAPAPVSYVANTADPTNDYHHQLFGGGGTPLQLAGDFNLTDTLVSPNMDFSGAGGTGIIGKKIQLVMDAGAMINPDPTGSGQFFTQASITVGASATLQAAGTGADGFTVSFVEDNFAGNGNFIQIYNGATLLDNLIPNPAGANAGFVEIFIDDLVDGNPWDGIGSTTLAVQVDGVPVGGLGPYTIGSGGLTSNIITLEGFHQSVGGQLATHTFDNLTVFTAPVPEPAGSALAVLALTALVTMRRRREAR